MIRNIDRRTLLAGAALSVAVGSGVAAARGEESDPGSRLAALFGSPSSARAIGRRYLTIRPEEASAAILVEAIVRDHPCAGTTERQLRDLMRRAIRDDFACGDTVTLDGWVLSVTEARLCALAALA